MPTSQTTSTAIFPDWEICPSSEGICASQESLTPPCFFDGPLSSSFLPSSLGEHFLGEAFASTGCFDLDPTVPTGQLSLNSTDGVDTCMTVDSTDSFDMLNPWQAQMDATTVGDFMELGALGVPHCVSRTPSLCSSEGSYSDITQSAGFTPTQESPSLLPRKRRRGQTGPTRTGGSLTITTPKPVSHNQGERTHPCTPSDEEVTSQTRARQAHSVIERRYRENLNSKIENLHRTLVATEFSLWFPANEDGDGEKEGSSRIRKSDILDNAMNYVHQSEIEMRHMSDEIRRLRDTIRTLEKLVQY